MQSARKSARLFVAQVTRVCIAMNWDAISAIGQIVGAIAVVATLLYLSRDIRGNSRSLAVSTPRLFLFPG
jgi:hypothetical protein